MVRSAHVVDYVVQLVAIEAHAVPETPEEPCDRVSVRLASTQGKHVKRAPPRDKEVAEAVHVGRPDATEIRQGRARASVIKIDSATIRSVWVRKSNLTGLEFTDEEADSRTPEDGGIDLRDPVSHDVPVALPDGRDAGFFAGAPVH